MVVRLEAGCTGYQVGAGRSALHPGGMELPSCYSDETIAKLIEQSGIDRQVMVEAVEAEDPIAPAVGAAKRNQPPLSSYRSAGQQIHTRE